MLEYPAFLANFFLVETISHFRPSKIGASRMLRKNFRPVFMVQYLGPICDSSLSPFRPGTS